MQKNTDTGYIRLHKKICNAAVVSTIVRLAGEWGLSNQDAAYRLLNDAAMREERRRIEIEGIRKLNTAALL